MGNRPVNRSRKNTGRTGYYRERGRSDTLRRRKRRNRRIKAAFLWLVCLAFIALLIFGAVKLVGRFAGSGKEQLRKDGIEKLNSGDLEGAVADFDAALEKSGNKSNKPSAFNADVLWYRAEAELLLKDYEAASHTYDLITEQGGDKISCLYMKAICAGALEDKDAAVSYYREALGMEKEGNRSDGYEEALTAAGSACVKAQDFDTAKSLYEEALNSVEEVRRSLLVALIERKLNKYFSEMDGLVKKLEKDKFILILCQRSLEELKEKRFSILEEVKSINIGNDMDVTISIGIGINGANYVQNYEYSRIAIDLALGRGGDQVVIKDRDTMIYFGGKSQQMGKTTRVKARVKAHALKEFMVAKDKVVVMGHKISDVDSIGAGIGIYRAAKSLNKRAHIVVNNPTMSVRPIIENFINNPEYDEHMFVNSAEAKEIVDNNTVVVVVDTNKPSYTECEDLLSKTKTIVVLDHHRQGAEVISNAVLSYIEPFASSACEMVAEILQYFSDGIRIYNIERTPFMQEL